MTIKAQIKDAAATTLLLTLGVWGAATLAAPGDSDVVVQKNSDGTVEAYDTQAKHPPAPPAPAQRHIIYRLKNDAGTRHINGVSVRTNPDGSIETFDNDSPAPRPRHAPTNTGAHKHK